MQQIDDKTGELIAKYLNECVGDIRSSLGKYFSKIKPLDKWHDDNCTLHIIFLPLFHELDTLLRAISKDDELYSNVDKTMKAFRHFVDAKSN